MSTMSSAFDHLPRVSLAHLPTPLEPLDRVSRSLSGPRIWLKRDDCTGLATGGNKTRKLEFLLGDARERQASAVITFGAVQSNHARQTAAACARLGLECHLVLARRVHWDHPEYDTNGNALLDRIVGATVHLCAPRDVERIGAELVERLERSGKVPYVVPTGGSNAVGALGYAVCAEEILAQAQALGSTPDLIVHASSSGGTQAGLLVGIAASRSGIPVLGINVSDRDGAAMEERIAALAAETAETLQHTRVSLPRVRLDHRFLGEDYGIPTGATIDAIRLAGELEGVVFDPVYSGKGFAGLLAMIRNGELADARNIVFIHTGGTASLPLYAAAF